MNDLLCNLSSCEWVTLASIFAITLSQGLTSDEIGILAGFFTALGDNLAIMANTNSCFLGNNSSNIC